MRAVCASTAILARVCECNWCRVAFRLPVTNGRATNGASRRCELALRQRALALG